MHIYQIIDNTNYLIPQNIQTIWLKLFTVEKQFLKTNHM